METKKKPPTSFWIISAIALIWNGMGVMAYLGQALMSDETLAQMPAEEVELINAMPA
ncbi:MAG: hypothetical protein RIC95_10735 [Vicingaceae bacterium]